MTKDNIKILKFGIGDKSVSYGTIGQEPAVFIEESEQIGRVGEDIPADKQPPSDKILDGAVVLIFPTEDQAIRVSDSLCNIQTSTTDSELIATAKKVVAIVDKRIAKGVESYPTWIYELDNVVGDLSAALQKDGKR